MPERETAAPPTRNSPKEFVEHLRTVHFALVAVSVALILVLSRPTSRALSQIRQIIELRKQWPPENLAYTPSMKMAGPAVAGKGEPIIWPIDWSQDNHFTASRMQRGPKGLLKFPVTVSGHSWLSAVHAGDCGPVNQFPNTLFEFRTWWNEWMNVHPCYLPIGVRGVGRVVRRGIDAGSVVIVPDEILSSAADASNSTIHRLVLSFFCGENVALKYTCSFAGGDQDDNLYEFPVATMQKGSLDQDAILSVVNRRGWKWAKGTFDGSFAELIQETGGLDFEELEQVEKSVAERLARRSEEFEAFGMKFPVAQITVWGTVILLGIQLYFFVYLRQLSEKLGSNYPTPDTPWMFLDRSRLARVICFATATILPVIAMLSLGCRASLRLTAGYWAPDSWHLLVRIGSWDHVVFFQIFVYLLATVFSTMLAILSWLWRPGVRQGTARQ